MRHKIKTTICNNFLCQIIGLMFNPIKKNMIFVMNGKERVIMHTFFMFYKIDVLFLDNKKQVVEAKRKLRPFNLYRSRVKPKYVLEMPDASKINLGDFIEF